MTTSHGVLPGRFLHLRGRSRAPRTVLLGESIETHRPELLEARHRNGHMYLAGVTGSGKSRLLASMICQDISAGRPLALIDPTGWLYRHALAYVSRCLETLSCEKSPSVADTMLRRSFRFLDLDDDDNPLRINPLEAQDGESSETLVDDFLVVVDRLFQSIEEMRRLRNVLRNTLLILAELNRLPPEKRPSMDGIPYPLNLRMVPVFLSLGIIARESFLCAVPDEPVWFAKQFFRGQFHQYSESQVAERVESTWNILQYFLADSLVARLFDTSRSTLSIPQLLRDRVTLLCHLPLGRNLKGCEVVGTYLAGKFQRAVYRRPPAERSRDYFLVLDECQHFVDETFSSATADVRQYGLRLIAAHQSMAQPPFHTAEGRQILETIKANSKTKLLFRLARPDAETMSLDVHRLTQRHVEGMVAERSFSRGRSLQQGRQRSWQVSRSATTTWTRAQGRAIARSRGVTIQEALGTNIGLTLARSLSFGLGQSVAEEISATEGEGITEMHSEADGLSIALGRTWGHMVDVTRGLSVTATDSEMLAVQDGESRTFGIGRQSGRTETNQRGDTRTWQQQETYGQSRQQSLEVTEGEQHAEGTTDARHYTITDESGNSMSREESQVAYAYRPRIRVGESEGMLHSRSEARQQGDSLTTSHATTSSSSRGTTVGASMARMKGVAEAAHHSFSRARSELCEVNASVSDSRATTRSTSTSLANGSTSTHGHRQSEGDSMEQARSRTTSISDSRQRTRTSGRSWGTTQTLSSSQEESLSHALSLMRQISRALAETLQETVNHTDSMAVARQHGVQVGAGISESTSAELSEGIRFRPNLLSHTGEREIRVNELQHLKQRQCVVSTEALKAVCIKTLFVPDQRPGRNGFGCEALLSKQRRLLASRHQTTATVPQSQKTRPNDTERLRQEAGFEI